MKKVAKFTIKEEDLAAVLDISLSQLDQVIAFFDADPDDEWELKEHDHFVYTNKTWGNRIFSAHGAFAIAKYLDTHEKKSLWDKIHEFVTHHKAKIRDAFVHRKVLENSSSLTFHNGRYFLSKKDTVAILSTSYARLNRSFDDIKRSEKPLKKFVDFDDIDNVRYYSFSGFFQLSRNLSETLTQQDRREWCGAVNIAGKSAIKAITSERDRHQKNIANAMKRAKTRDRKTCQITQNKPDRYHKFDLASHHIFSSSHYPHLAVVVDNIITLTDEVHEEFHSWNGGSKNPCTADDLIQFVCDRYPGNPEVLTQLYKVKHMFSHESQLAGDRLPSDQRQFSSDQAA